MVNDSDIRRICIIIPTYNERENITRLIPIVLAKDERIEVLVVDDGSPDGTAEAVKRLQAENGRVHLLERPSKMGLGTAYVAGFRFALDADFDLIFEMDADFSHDPRYIPQFIETAAHYDLVIGSRYISGVNVINWPMPRLVLSWSANRYTRLVTRLPLKDATAGYKCFRRQALAAIDLNRIHSDGYAFQIEMDFKVWKQGGRVKEIPIIFVDRTVGESKMHPGIIKEAAWMVWKLRILSLLGRL